MSKFISCPFSRYGSEKNICCAFEQKGIKKKKQTTQKRFIIFLSFYLAKSKILLVTQKLQYARCADLPFYMEVKTFFALQCLQAGI